VLVDRKDRESALAAARRATEALRRGRSFAVFAEGTRTRDGRVLPFKKGAFHMAIEAGVPVVPVSIDGAFEAMPPGSLRLGRVPVRVVIHDPIPTAGLTVADVDELAERARTVVASAVRAGLATAPTSTAPKKA
jgi:1-acyl-sn-glycerol-3-phosphate acyltransferase